MKKTVAFTVADSKNLKYAFLLIKSFKYFHPDIPIVLWTDEQRTEKLPKDCEIRLLVIQPDIFYKQKPFFANILFNEGYEAVLGLDADMIILGSLDYIFKHDDYDIGTVLNFNPLDFRTYGPITFQPIHYATEYQNAGLVMMRNHNLVKHWLKLCSGPFFKRFPYKEQDIMNLIIFFGEYKHKCFDDADKLENYYAWHGLLATHQGLKMKVIDKDVILPKSEDGYPSQDIKVKVWHPAQGQVAYDKMNYRIEFSESVIQRINEILGVNDETDKNNTK